MSGFYNGLAPAGGYLPAPQVPPVKTKRPCTRWAAILAPAVLAAALLVGLVAFHGGSSGTKPPTVAGSGIATLAGAPRTSAPSDPNNFTAPTFIPAGAVPAYRGSLTGFVIPQGLTLQMAQIQTSGAQYQLLAADSQNVVKSIIEAWAAGAVNAARYDSWCVSGCAGTFDPLITKYGAHHPRGTLQVSNWTGGLANGSSTSAEVGVCVDDSALSVTTGSGIGTEADPYIQGPTFWAFGLVLDPALHRWVATEAYQSPGSSYCTSQ
jgi:hypothetical protein